MPDYARVSPLERALVSSAARWASRAELTSLVVRSAIQVAGTIIYEVQTARRTMEIQIEAAVAEARLQTAYELGQRYDRLIQSANTTFSDPGMRRIYQDAARRHGEEMMRRLLK